MASVRNYLFSRLIRRADETLLPERVRREIHLRELAAERLTGWVQLSIVLLFCTLYAIAPRAEGSGGFNFVPLALGLYLLFTVLRLGLSYRFELPVWFLMLSVVVDMALLVGLIFSFHIQYNQHPTFYLKTPTLMYAFIFISLRALRFDPRFVLTAGLVAVTGWLALVAYAVLADMGGMHVTRNYVEYLTSNTILIGAELDKTIVILTVTFVLTAAIHRARVMFFDAIRDQTAARDLSRFFSTGAAASITGADVELKAGEGVRREVAVLTVDIRNFTRTSATLAPETVMKVLALYQELALEVIASEGGEVDKFLGDGILATFGAMQESHCFAADALNCACRLAAALEAEQDAFAKVGWPERLRTGIAVAAGPVTVGVVGAHGRLEMTVIGDPVNRCVKLEAANKTEGTRCLTDEVTFQRACQQGFSAGGVAARPARPVAGLSDAEDLRVLV